MVESVVEYRLEEMSSGETKKKEKGDDDLSLIVDIGGATLNVEKSNQFQETSDIITENNFQAIPMEVIEDNIQKSVQILLGGEKEDNSIDRYSSSISLVPSLLRDLNPESFNPQVISIGPLHHEDENLKGSEGFKRTCMRDLLDRVGSPPDQTLAACLRKVSESIQKIRRCYVGMRPYSDDELSIMMVTDGCFILEVLSQENELNDLLWEHLSSDLLLIENQIPFFVLKYIFEYTILKYEPSASLTDHIKILLQQGHHSLLEESFELPDVLEHATEQDHILSLLHKCYQPQFSISQGSSSLICNVVELEKAGVSFMPNQYVTWPLAIKIEWSRSTLFWFSWFWAKPTLKIPVMNIEDGTEKILRNIIAYEQTSEVDQYFTSYAFAIDDLVDSGSDIAKLVESGVVVNRLGSNEEAANLINGVCKNIMQSNFYIDQWKELETYYNGYWPRNIAWLRRTYFNNPWNIIALIAGIILFALTMTQTYFTINPIN